MALAVSALYMPQALARETESPCDKLKPVQTLSVEEQKKVDAAFNLAVVGWGKGAGDATTEAGSKTEMQVLASDDLARAWFVYQFCVQKEAGIIDEQTAQELVRKLMGLSPTAPAAVTPPAPAGSSKEKASSAATVTASMPEGQGELSVKCAYQDAELIVDDKSYGMLGSSGTKMYLPVGNHDVQVKVKGMRTYVTTVQIKAGKTESVDVTSMKKQSVVRWIILGAVVVAAIVGVAALAGGSGGSVGGDTTFTDTSGTYSY